MFGTYPVMIDGKQLGELTVRQDGIMTLFEARCADTGTVLRLSVYGETEGYLGVMMPDGEGMLRLRKRLSRASLSAFPNQIRFAGIAGLAPEQKEEMPEAEESCADEESQPAHIPCEMPMPEPETPAADEVCTADVQPKSETEIQWRRAAGGALVGTQGQMRYLAVPLKSGVAPVGGNFEKRRIEDAEYAVFEIKNGKII